MEFMCIVKCFFLIESLKYGTQIAANPDNIWSALIDHPAWIRLNEIECGESAADRIIGGTNAVLGQFPWIARLGYVSEEDMTTEWMCGGALLTNRHILTAAHCIETDGYNLSWVRLGEHDIRTDPDCQLGVCATPVQDLRVGRIIRHPLFLGLHNDIAILELEKPASINDYVSPICLPRGEQMAELKVGEPLTVAGWGKVNITTDDVADILQVVQIPLLKPESCDTFGTSYKISKGELCAGAHLNRDACGGDSGGPLMKVFDTLDGPKTFIVGIVSFGPTMCGIKKPGVYSSTTYFLKWVLDNLSR